MEIESKECNICYNITDNIINLKCCNNSKNICNDCLKCLKSRICPYCRNNLPNYIINQYKNLSSSLPVNLTLDEWTNNEIQYLLIDPELYPESRILRRQIRRIRNNYFRQNNSYDTRIFNRRDRRNLRNYTRLEMNSYNSSPNSDINYFNNDYIHNNVNDNLNLSDTSNNINNNYENDISNDINNNIDNNNDINNNIVNGNNNNINNNIANSNNINSDNENDIELQFNIELY